jgi:hypothetical protein
MMKIQAVSQKAAGKWAAALTLLFILLITLKVTLWIPVPTPLIAGFGVAGLIVGIVSFFKNRDRSLLTLLSVLVGLLIVFWAAAEIAFPH